MQTTLTDEIKKLSIPERIFIVEEIWDSIAQENESFDLTEQQRLELDKRIESLNANPEQGRTWDEIKAEYMNRR